MYKFKRYLKNYFLFLVSLFIILIIFTILVDPYGDFNIVNIDRFNKIKTRKYSDKSNWIKTTKKNIVSNKYETIFLGSSRVLRGLNPDFLPESNKGYNAAYSGANFYDFELFKNELEKSNVKRIIWGIDFGEGIIDGRVTNQEKSTFILLKLENIISSQSLYDSVVTVFDNIFLTKHGLLKIDNGFLVTEENKSKINYAHHFNIVEDRFKRRLNRIKSINYNSIIKKELSFVEWLVKLSKENNIDIYIYISPVHRKILDLVVDSSFFEDYKAWIKLLSKTIYATNSPQNSVELWDFSGYNSITKEAVPTINHNFPMKWYIDPSHYRETVGNMILEILFNLNKIEVPTDFGVKLNLDNVDNHIEKMYLRYRK